MVGIDPQNHKNLFQPFNRLGYEAGEIEGTGIGLAITKQLVAAMGGAVGYSSQPGQGSSFWIDIPAVTESASLPEDCQPALESVVESPAADTPVTVLYVEDNSANQDLMIQLIHLMGGIEIISADTAELGLELANQKQPSLILMDINLPGMTGVEAMQALACEEKTRDIPVIAVTSAAQKDDIERGMRAGFSNYITKLFDVPAIMSAIRKTIGTSP